MTLAARISDVIAANRATPGLRVGVALRWIEAGEEIMVDADEPVPLVSDVKVPALVEAFHARQRYNERFPCCLPAGARVAHKTGSFAGVSNDAGVLYVADEAQVAFADHLGPRSSPRESGRGGRGDHRSLGYDRENRPGGLRARP